MDTVENPEVVETNFELQRAPEETPLFICVVISAITAWIFLTVSVVGILYAVFLGLFFFLSHMSLIAYLRGSAVKITADQFPDLHVRIKALSERAGLLQAPDAYILQSEGALNALATKFFGCNFIVLYSDLLEACGSDTQAQDMIIGHEIAHIKAGHLKGMWFLVPGMFCPFIGTGYSRARELTCDAYGAKLCGSHEAAVRGLTILSVGGRYSDQVDVEKFVKQKADLNTGLMQIAAWCSGYPPLCERIAAVDKTLGADLPSTRKGEVSGFIILAVVMILPSIVFMSVGPKLASLFNSDDETSYEEMYEDVYAEEYDEEYVEEPVDESIVVPAALPEKVSESTAFPEQINE